MEQAVLKLEMVSYSDNAYDVTNFCCCCFEQFLAYTLFLPSFIVVRHQKVELNWGGGLFCPPVHYRGIPDPVQNRIKHWNIKTCCPISMLENSCNISTWFWLREAHSWMVVKNQLRSWIQCLRDQICSDLFGIGSTIVWTYSVYMGLVGNKNGMVSYWITFISGLIWYQMADSIHTGSTSSHVETRLICTNFITVPNRSITL